MLPQGMTFEEFTVGIPPEDYELILVKPSGRSTPCDLARNYYRVWFFDSQNWSLAARISPPEDLRSVRLLGRLEKLGLQPRSPFTNQERGMFGFTLLREYGAADFKSLEFFEPHPIGHVGEMIDRSNRGRLKLKKGHLRLRNFLGRADRPWLVVSSDMRVKVEKAGLKSLYFKETEAAGRTLKDDCNQIWELDSSLELPPMSAKCDFRYEIGGGPFEGDYSKGRALVEGFYSPPEFHYTQTAIKSVGEFDLARTHERWGDGDAPRKLVCSRRFYQFCHDHGIKMEWIPVRIDA